MLKRLLISLFFVVPTVINSDEILSESKVFVEKLGQEVVEKVSNSSI